MDLKESLGHITDAIHTELTGAKLLSGDEDTKFREVFQITSKSDIYYNKLNIIITDEELMDNLKHFLKAEDRVLSVEVPEYYTHLWVYSYFNNSVVGTYVPKLN